MHKVPRLIRILEKTDLHSITQHGGSSRILRKDLWSQKEICKGEVELVKIEIVIR